MNTNKYLCIDYGRKKVGLAKSDEAGQLAFPFKIIKNESREKLLKEILDILEKLKINKIIIGESLNNKGQLNEIDKEVKDFAEDLMAYPRPFPQEREKLEIFFEKEWYSTVEARRYENKKNSDDSAAAIILQRYLDRVNQRNKKCVE